MKVLSNSEILLWGTTLLYRLISHDEYLDKGMYNVFASYNSIMRHINVLFFSSIQYMCVFTQKLHFISKNLLFFVRDNYQCKTMKVVNLRYNIKNLRYFSPDFGDTLYYFSKITDTVSQVEVLPTGRFIVITQQHQVIFSCILYTVESPNNGQVGDMTFVLCRELSASWRLLK